MSATATSLDSQSEVLFTIRHNQISFSNDRGTDSNREANSRRETEEVTTNDAHTSEEQDSILCILWKNGKMGAAYFKTSEQQLYVLKELVDLPPEFPATRSLYREINPSHIVTMGSQYDQFIKCIINLATDENSDSTTESMKTNTLPRNMSLVHLKECAFEVCKEKVFGLKLPNEPEDATDAQKAVFLHSIVDFDCKLSVHALGALIMFIERNWTHLSVDRNEELRFLGMNQISLSDCVFMDRNTFNALKVFKVHAHDARFNHGRASSNCEGLSLFKLLSQHCKSKMGFLCLRKMLMNPIKSIVELNKRLDFIQFALIPSNQGFIEGLQDCIKKTSEIHMILRKLQYARASGGDWKNLYNTIYQMLLLHELCGPHRASSSLLSCLDASISTELYNLHYIINDALDFTRNSKRNRPTIRFGLDVELDAKMLQKQDIARNVTAAAQFAVSQLPDFLNECSVVHIPEMGHFIAVKEWEPKCDRMQLQDYGFQFVFAINDVLHYKNPMCLELDTQLGGIHQDILSHENRIIERLTDFILRKNKEIREPLKIIAMIDCLISISRVAKERGYVRPRLNEEGLQVIKGGRHPLLELFSADFVPNDFHSGGNYSHLKILTGPNDSGKSVYLKQTALIIFLAHVGLYVPAKQADIGMVHSIHSRIHATESAGITLSAFMVDLSQMSEALHNAKSTSLVILDEFGRGTTGDDGTALLAAALKKFSSQEEFCPHILVSTHYQQLCQFLPKSSLVGHLRMDHTRNDSRELVFLYKVVEGVSNSFAFDVAAAIGLDTDVVARAREIYQTLYGTTNASSLQSQRVARAKLNLSDINIPEPDD